MDLSSSSWGYRSEDASREHFRVMICALFVRINIHVGVRGESFNHELSIFTEQIVGLGAHLDFSDGSSAGSPSGLVPPTSETCCSLKDLSSDVVKLIE